MEQYILLWSFATFVGYIGWVVWKYGILPSISESFYKHGSRLLFAGFIWLTVLPLTYLGMESIWMQAAGGVLCFVGIATKFKSNTIERYFHNYGAALGFLLAFASMTFTFQLWPLSVIMMMFLILSNVLKINNVVWWNEIVGFLLLMIGFYVKINLEL